MIIIFTAHGVTLSMAGTFPLFITTVVSSSELEGTMSFWIDFVAFSILLLLLEIIMFLGLCGSVLPICRFSIRYITIFTGVLFLSESTF